MKPFLPAVALLLPLIASGSAFAARLLPAEPAREMECHVLVYAKDKTQGLDETFRVENPANGHATAERTFEAGASRVVVNVNRQGLQLEWYREGTLRAQAWAVIQESQTKAIALLVYDPVREGDQASVDCSFPL